uniref:dTMP kinase n=2 Tax=Oryza TaxID=4527 RepID=A0A0D3GU29_9ORYZ
MALVGLSPRRRNRGPGRAGPNSDEAGRWAGPIRGGESSRRPPLQSSKPSTPRRSPDHLAAGDLSASASLSGKGIRFGGEETCLAGKAISWSSGVKAAAGCGLGLLPQWRGVFRSVRMESGSSQGGRGALIVLEGLDRSGKSSQCARLLSFLQGKGCQAEGWRFPDRGTSVGQMISAYLANESELDDRTIHLLFSANRWEKRALMERKLLGGTTLIVDRYSYSGVAFSAAKGLDIEWCKAPENGLIAPDLVVYLDVQPEVVDGSLPMEVVEEQLKELAMSCILECQSKQLASLAW